ncbi:PspC domain-containing protein [Demequina sp. SO4-13]|uniref:PspC domain-containing protein n=1 Tax=Demequina sp. SO4-13 TaxID=3401027 RepID=UPI003AF4F03F
MTEQPQPQKEAAFFTAIRQWGLTRGQNGVVGGVVEGLGARVGMAAVPARLIVVLAWFLMSGFVMLAYAAAWGLLPDRRGNIIIQNFGRGVTNVGALLGIAVLTLFGFGSLSSGPLIGPFGGGADPWIWDNVLGNGDVPGFARVLVVLLAITIPLLVLSGVIVLIVWLVKRSKSDPPSGGTQGWAAMPDAPAGSGAAGAADAGVAAGTAGAAGAATTPPPAPTPAEDGGTGTPSAERARASAAGDASTYSPQPWEPALTPGDPRLAGGPATASFPTAERVPPVPPAPPVPPVPHAPYSPPRPRVPGPGKGGYLAFLGVLLVSAAVVIGVDRADRLAVNPVLAWGAVVTVGLGAVLIVVALTGRKLGFLGFLSVVAVVAGVPLAANAAEIRSAYDEPWGWWEVEMAISESTAEPTEEAVPVEPSADLTEPFASDYTQVSIPSGCWALSSSDDPGGASDPQWWSDNGQTSIRLNDVMEDETLEIGEGATRITVPSGTSVEVSQTDDVYLVWEERDLVCDLQYAFSDVTGDWLSATNPGDPVVTIEPTGAGAAVFIQEEQS